jgi:hypothetical protein
MKRLILLLFLFLLLPLAVAAQTPDPAQLAEMKKLDFLVGQWKGEGWIVLGPGQRRTFRQTENVQRKLDGLLLSIEGLGKGNVPGKAEEVTVHNAFAVVSYDSETKAFRFHAYSGDGSTVAYIDSEAQVSAKTLVWGFHHPRGGDIRFTITLNEKEQWLEVGEFSRDGKTWQKFFEMTLNRVA